MYHHRFSRALTRVDITALTTFLAPCLTFLLDTAAGARAKDALGEVVWGRAQALWAKLRPAVEASTDASEAAALVAAAPDDPLPRGALAWQIAKALEADPALAASVEREWSAAGSVSVAVGRDVIRSTIVAGDGNVIR
jgi:hypothetical protein